MLSEVSPWPWYFLQDTEEVLGFGSKVSGLGFCQVLEKQQFLGSCYCSGNQVRRLLNFTSAIEQNGYCCLLTICFLFSVFTFYCCYVTVQVGNWCLHVN
jgi:hypothetical protein